MRGVPFDGSKATWSRPVDDGVQLFSSPVITARRCDQGQDQLGRPCQEPIAKLLGDSHGLAVQFVCLIPLAGEVVVEREHHQGVES
jgi:hypothetical protein